MLNTEKLDESVAHCRQELHSCPRWNPDHPDCLYNLANALFDRFKQLGRMEDLKETIAHYRQVLEHCPRGNPHHPTFLNNLANALSTRFEELGRIEDLEEAIMYHRQALDLHPLWNPHHPSSLNNLANAISARFEKSRRMEDLEEAITCHRRALDLRPPGHPDHSSSLNNLASTILVRFGQSGQMQDLEEAIISLRQALDLHTSSGHPLRSSSLNNLAIAISTRFEKLRQTKDLEEAITYLRQALYLFPPGHPDRFSSLINLANAVSTRFELFQQMEDLEEAIQHCSEAITALRIDHPIRASVALNLASLLLKRCTPSQTSDDSLHTVSEALMLLEHAANHSSASAQTRFQAAVQWAGEARRFQHQSTIDAYITSLTLLDRCLTTIPTVEEQQKFLAASNTVLKLKSLTLDAASSAINAGRLDTAVELLERGRAILWSKLRGYRHPLEILRDTNRDLADEFETLSSQLEHHAMSSKSELKASPLGLNQAGSALSFDAKMQIHRILSEKWDKVVRNIRQMDGYEAFLQTIPFSTLRTAAAEGPVVIINISKYRSDAIILCDVGHPALVPLPTALPADLTRLSSQLELARTVDSKDSARQTLPILRSLWDTIAFPVRKQLVALNVPDKSRIWWCPTSELCALPLHAAGAYSRMVAKPNNIPDCYISSYTPTLSALIRARSGVVRRSTDPRLLVIAQPSDTLPEVKAEIRHIQRLANSVDVLEGPEANCDSVLSGLRSSSWAHFACHSHVDNQPFRSSFQLHDRSSLALVDVIRARLTDAEFAFLSACHTAAGDMVGTPDEVIHLAAALQFCGFRSVVGTLWAMEDVDGRDATEHFYRHMFRTPGTIPNFRDSAEALNLATRIMRKRGLGLDRWVKFVHIGA